MKSYFFTTIAVSLCLLTVPFWAMHKSATADTSAIAENADDSSSTESSISELGTAQLPDKKSKTFFIYIANDSAATFFHEVLQCGFSVTNWKRTIARSGHIFSHEKLFRKTKKAQRLCRIIKSAIAKFDVISCSTYEDLAYGLAIELITREEQSFKAIAQHCQKSEYIDDIFAGEADWNQYCASLEKQALANADIDAVKRSRGWHKIDHDKGIEFRNIVNSTSGDDDSE